MWKRLLLLPLFSYNSGKLSVAQKSLFSELQPRALRTMPLCQEQRRGSIADVYLSLQRQLPAFMPRSMFVKYCSGTMLLFIVPSTVKLPRRGPKCPSGLSESDASDEAKEKQPHEKFHSLFTTMLRQVVLGQTSPKEIRIKCVSLL